MILHTIKEARDHLLVYWQMVSIYIGAPIPWYQLLRTSLEKNFETGSTEKEGMYRHRPVMSDVVKAMEMVVQLL